MTSGSIKLTIKIIQDSECSWGEQNCIFRGTALLEAGAGQMGMRGVNRSPDVQALMSAFLVPARKCCVFCEFMSQGGDFIKCVAGSASTFLHIGRT